MGLLVADTANSAAKLGNSQIHPRTQYGMAPKGVRDGMIWEFPVENVPLRLQTAKKTPSRYKF